MATITCKCGGSLIYKQSWGFGERIAFLSAHKICLQPLGVDGFPEALSNKDGVERQAEPMPGVLRGKNQ